MLVYIINHRNNLLFVYEPFIDSVIVDTFNYHNIITYIIYYISLFRGFVYQRLTFSLQTDIKGSLQYMDELFTNYYSSTTVRIQ